MEFVPTLSELEIGRAADAGAVVSASIAAMLGAAIELVTPAVTISRPGYAATISVSATADCLCLHIGMACGATALKEFGRLLLGDTELPADVLDDILREMANTAAGALKRAAELDGVRRSMGLPSDSTVDAIAERVTRNEPCFTCRLIDSEHCFTVVVDSGPASSREEAA